jgi:hypothetical protein
MQRLCKGPEAHVRDSTEVAVAMSKCGFSSAPRIIDKEAASESKSTCRLFSIVSTLQGLQVVLHITQLKGETSSAIPLGACYT